MSKPPTDRQIERYRNRVEEARKDVERYTKGLTKPCPMCGHLPYPIVDSQHCWCDPADLEPPGYDPDAEEHSE